MSKIEHVGLIPDGNRRWAIKNKLDYKIAYKKTMLHIIEVIDWIFELQIKYLSIYLLSKENLERARQDLEAVIYAEEYFLSDILYPICEKYQCKVIHVGNSELLPKAMNNKIDNIVNQTKAYNDYKLYLLLGYNPIDDLNKTIKLNPNKLININSLSVPHKINLVIRTAGGSCLLSNFLPIQCGYAQFYIIDEYFNDIEKKHIKKILSNASNIKMLYGK